MDMTSQRAAKTAPIHLKGLDGQLLYSDGDLAKPVRIHVFGPGTKQQAAAEARQTQRALKRLEENDGRPNPPSPDVRRAEAAEDLASVTSHFENVEYSPAGDAQGAPLFEALYADPDLGHITAQVARGVGNWAVFKPASATS